MAFCGNCGASTTQATGFCGTCGKPIGASAPANASQTVNPTVGAPAAGWTPVASQSAPTPPRSHPVDGRLRLVHSNRVRAGLRHLRLRLLRRNLRVKDGVLPPWVRLLRTGTP